jgi:predicted membrane protein
MKEVKMDYQKELPFSSYNELVLAINENKAKLSFQRSTAYSLSCRSGYKSTILSSLGVVLGLLVLLGCSYFHVHNYWVMLFIIVLIPLHTTIPYTKKLLIPIGIILGILPFIIHRVIWLSAIGFSLIALCIGYEIWWSSVYNKAQSMLLNDENIFEEVWLSGKVAIKTSSDINGFFVHMGKQGGQ